MLAAQLTGLRTIAIAEIAAPRIAAADDVLVRVRAVGICGSDVHNYAAGGIGKRKVVYPFIPGHEAAGEVVAVGPGVTRVKSGDRVMIEPAHHCGACDQCLAGRFNTCRHIQFMSSAEELQGCMCELVVVPERNCFPFGDSLSFEQAAVVEPLSIAVYSVARSVPMGPQTAIAILGAGPIGLCTLLAARAAGARRFFVTDRLASRLAAARALGAGWTGNPEAGDVVAAIKAEEPLEMDVVFECCGQPEALDQAVDLLKPGGMLILTGIPEGSRIALCIDTLRRKETTIFNVRRQNACVERAIALIASGAVNVDALITHRVPLADAQRAFDLVADYADGVIKAMVVNETSGRLAI